MKNRKWKKVKCHEMIKYAKDHGLYKIGPRDASLKDPGFSRAVYRKGFAGKIFKSGGYRKLLEMSVDELIDYAVSNNLYGLNPREGELKDPGFYQHVRKRSIVDKIFIRKYVVNEEI